VCNRLEVALPPGECRDDAQLTVKANDALTLDHSVAVGVKATAEDGIIVLTGETRCGAERLAAETMIAALTGVRGVAAQLHHYGEPMEQA
jgi:osmotically-inducible protein OsmY